MIRFFFNTAWLGKGLHMGSTSPLEILRISGLFVLLKTWTSEHTCDVDSKHGLRD